MHTMSVPESDGIGEERRGEERRGEERSGAERRGEERSRLAEDARFALMGSQWGNRRADEKTPLSSLLFSPLPSLLFSPLPSLLSSPLPSSTQPCSLTLPLCLWVRRRDCGFVGQYSALVNSVLSLEGFCLKETIA